MIQEGSGQRKTPRCYELAFRTAPPVKKNNSGPKRSKNLLFLRQNHVLLFFGETNCHKVLGDINFSGQKRWKNTDILKVRHLEVQKNNKKWRTHSGNEWLKEWIWELSKIPLKQTWTAWYTSCSDFHGWIHIKHKPIQRSNRVGKSSSFLIASHLVEMFCVEELAGQLRF